MVRPANPFSPSFGISPPVLAGRRTPLSDFETIFGNVRSPSYATLLWGLRGTGKTVLLNAFEDRSAAHGWLSIAVAAATPMGLLNDIAVKAIRQLEAFEAEHGSPPARVVSGVSLGMIGIQTESAVTPEPVPQGHHDLETVLSRLGDVLAEQGTGLLITIDELHVADVDEIKQFGSIFQLVSRRAERPIAFAGAALPELERRLLSGPSGTFLQRCHRHEIGNLTMPETEVALRDPIVSAGARIDADSLRTVVDASNGQPYFVQLIGASLWDESEDPVAGIRADEAERAVANARSLYGQHVHAPVWHRLSDLDKRFLIAMLEDRGSSAIADIGTRWQHDSRSLSRYRQRLLSAGLIRSVGHGRVAFVDDAARAFVSLQALAEGWIEQAQSGDDR